MKSFATATVIAAATAFVCAAPFTSAAALETLATAGTLVVVPATGEVRHANDEVVVLLAVEEVDTDKAAAATRVNQKMKEGAAIVKSQDPQASLKTQGYYTYPVYPEEHLLSSGPSPRPNKPRVPTSWRIGQYLRVTTTSLDLLPKTVAAAQKILTLNNLQFGLTPETTRQLDDQRIAATYKNLNERIASIASAMGRKVSDATLDTVDFDGAVTSAYTTSMAAARAVAPMAAKSMEVAEPSFEPGETTLQMRLVGKVRFK